MLDGKNYYLFFVYYYLLLGEFNCGSLVGLLLRDIESKGRPESFLIKFKANLFKLF